jgi:hypothetical protein
LLQLLKSEELSHFQRSQRNGGAKILARLPAVAKIGDLLSRASWKPGSCLMDMCLVCLWSGWPEFSHSASQALCYFS